MRKRSFSGQFRTKKTDIILHVAVSKYEGKIPMMITPYIIERTHDMIMVSRFELATTPKFES